MADSSTDFNYIYEKYKSQEGKYESQYIFVLHDIKIEDVIEKVKKMIGIVDEIKNINKKKLIKSKLSNFVKILESVQKESVINGIYMVSDDVEFIDITKTWKHTLVHFNCDNFIVKYGDNFELEWLGNLLNDTTYIHVLHIKNNNLKHYHLNSTKRKNVLDKEEKSMCISNYISENVSKNEHCIVHGVSSLIKSISQMPNVKILNGSKKDDEILFEYNKLLNDKKLDDLKWWLDRFTDPKESHKIVFSKEIEGCIKSKTLAKLFCTSEIRKKILNKIPEEYRSFEIIEILSFGDDIGKTLASTYGGIIGIKYY